MTTSGAATETRRGLTPLPLLVTKAPWGPDLPAARYRAALTSPPVQRTRRFPPAFRGAATAALLLTLPRRRLCARPRRGRRRGAARRKRRGAGASPSPLGDGGAVATRPSRGSAAATRLPSPSRLSGVTRPPCPPARGDAGTWRRGKGAAALLPPRRGAAKPLRQTSPPAPRPSR